MRSAQKVVERPRLVAEVRSWERTGTCSELKGVRARLEQSRSGFALAAASFLRRPAFYFLYRLAPKRFLLFALWTSPQGWLGSLT